MDQATPLQLAGRHTYPADRLDSGPCFSSLRPVSSVEVYKIISTLPPKLSPLDFIPTSLIKRCSSVFTDIIVNLANLSFEQGRFPTSYKPAVVTPLLKKIQVSMHPYLLTIVQFLTLITSLKFLKNFLWHVYNRT